MTNIMRSKMTDKYLNLRKKMYLSDDLDNNMDAILNLNDVDNLTLEQCVCCNHYV